MRIVATHRTARIESDVLIDADGGTPIDSVAAAIGMSAADGISLNGRVVVAGTSIVDAGLHQGAVLGDTRWVEDVRELGLVDLGVAGGQGAGRLTRLGPGQHSVGGSRGDTILPGVPDGALVLRVDSRGRVLVRSAAPGLEVFLGAERVGEEFVRWDRHVLLRVGAALLQHRPAAEPDAVLEFEPESGTFAFNRPPRMTPPMPEGSFRIPAAPQVLAKSSLPWLSAAAPLLIGVVMALVLHSAAYLAFALLSPLMLVMNSIVAKRQGRISHRVQVEDHRRLVERIEHDVEDRRRAESVAMTESTPSAATLRSIATGPSARVWERRPGDRDHLLVRVGAADVMSRVVVEDLREQLEYQRRTPTLLRDVPAAIRLDEVGVVGVAGPRMRARGTAAWMLGQLGVLQSPKDVTMIVLVADGDASWSWVSWLPHVAPAAGQDTRALVGNDAETVGRRIAEVTRLIDDRRAARRGGVGHERVAPDVVVVLDGARRLRAYPGVPAILREGPSVGVYAICVETAERSLPEECGAVITHRPDGSSVLRRSDHEALQGIIADDVDAAWFPIVSRALAPVHDAGDDGDDGIPSSARLTQVLELEPVTPEVVGARWVGGGRSTSAVIGLGLDGPFAIDLVADGPHGLVAGTTGSGKSEFLQSLVASLAVANRPDAMNFVLVDYKGGAAFKDAVRLPHTVGMVTDLDAHLVERALVSLGAELTRREHLLAGAGAKDIEDYVHLLKRNPSMCPMPRLLIVIDEFASMARELPDFVTGLVNIAQRGRSLGIHLILATQRPSGVVSGEIRANTNLRIALRVTDAADSTDVIDAPDAARIPAGVPGRAYVRLGHASLVPFQTARVGGRAVGATGPAVRPPFIAKAPWATAGYPLPTRRAVDGPEDEMTDLRRLVDAAQMAANHIDLKPNHAPWLAPLADRIVLDSLVAPGTHSVETEASVGRDPRLQAVAWALGDAPQRQAQDPVLIDLATFGHMFVVGAARSGRSQALRTLAAALADRHSSSDLHLFGIDMGNGALLPLTRLPHTGAVVQRSERDRLMRLLERLQAELTRRQEMLGRLGVADIGEQRVAAAPADQLPHLVVLLDRWESYVSTYGDQDAGALVERIHVLLREGASAGIHVVLAGDRSLLTGRISVLTEDKWLLRPAERTDFTMASLNPRKLPDHIGDGRAFHAGDGLEAQIALLAPDPSASAQSAAIDQIADRARVRDDGLLRDRRPMRIDVLPADLTEAALADFPEPEHGHPWLRLGVGGDELELLGADLSVGSPSFLVAGPARSGRSSVLVGIVRSLLAAKTPVVLVCPRPSPLIEAFTGHDGVLALVDRSDIAPDDLAAHLAGDDPLVLVMDDGEQMRDAPSRDVIRKFLQGAPGRGRALVVAGNAAEIGGGFGGWQSDLKNGQRGALLSPRNIFDGDLVGLRVSRSATALPVTPGRATVNLGDGVPRVVQIPRPTPAGQTRT